MALVALVGSTILLFLLIFRAPTWACLFCFTTYEERLRVCQMFADTDGPNLGHCKDAFKAAFEGLSDVEISEETLVPEPGPWGAAGETSSDSTKKSLSTGLWQRHRVERRVETMEGNTFRKGWRQRLETVPQREAKDAEGLDRIARKR